MNTAISFYDRSSVKEKKYSQLFLRKIKNKKGEYFLWVRIEFRYFGAKMERSDCRRLEWARLTHAVGYTRHFTGMRFEHVYKTEAHQFIF